MYLFSVCLCAFLHRVLFGLAVERDAGKRDAWRMGESVYACVLRGVI